MRWGISVPCQPPFDVAKMVAGIAGPLGFESIWLWDHLLGLWHNEANPGIGSVWVPFSVPGHSRSEPQPMRGWLGSDDARG